MATRQVKHIDDVCAISTPVGVGTQAGMMVIGQRLARGHPSGRKLTDGIFAICLSLQMTAN